MKLVSFGPKGKEKPGVIIKDQVLDLTAADPTLPPTMRGILEEATGRVKDILLNAGKLPSRIFTSLEEVRLGPPIIDPSKIICLGLNYIDHAREQGKEVPDWPLIFAKAPSCLAGHCDPIVIPPGITQLDHEVELAFVIGKKAKNVPIEEAHNFIAGYGVFMDISARDIQFREKQWFRGKSFDTFGPFGPFLTTTDDVPDPHNLQISLAVNGKAMQKSNTGNMRFKVDYLAHYLSHSMTLEPGDIVATGTPAGVGVFANPPRFLQKGDLLEASIKSLGKLINSIA